MFFGIVFVILSSDNVFPNQTNTVMKTILFSAILLFVSQLLMSQTDKRQETQQIIELTQKIAKESGNLSLYYLRADLFDELNNFSNANRDYNKVIELYKKNPDEKFTGEFAKASYRLGDDYFFRLSKKEQALKYVTEGLKKAPEFKDLEILEAIILGAVPGNQELVSEKYQKLAVKYPKDGRLLLHYAKFLEGSNPIAAATQYENVLKLNPLNRDILVTLGTLYNNEASRLSHTATSSEKVFEYAMKATHYFEKAYRLKPNDEELQTLIQLLYSELDIKEEEKNLPY